MNAQLEPNLRGHKILKVLHAIILIITVAYLAAGVVGVAALWHLQPNVVGNVTSIIALCFTALGLYWLFSWFASWTIGWFECGMIQSGVWRDTRNCIASAIAFLVGLSCITSAATWLIERL